MSQSTTHISASPSGDNDTQIEHRTRTRSLTSIVRHQQEEIASLRRVQDVQQARITELEARVAELEARGLPTEQISPCKIQSLETSVWLNLSL